MRQQNRNGKTDDSRQNQPNNTHENGKKKRCQRPMPRGTSNTGTAKQDPSRRETELGREADSCSQRSLQ